MAFTEFFCRSGGSNLNGGGQVSGAEQGTAAAYTSTNGNWNGTTIFTPTDGSTPSATVNVGDFASIFLDAAVVGVFLARVTAVAAGVNGAITVSGTAQSGAAPASGATGRTIKVGGAWKGPNAAETFPIGLVGAALTNAAGDYPRINFKNNGTYSITAATTSANGPIVYQGYTTTAGDLGKATIDGGVAGASYALLSSGSDMVITDLIFQNNGATGSAQGVQLTSARVTALRCVVNNVQGSGFTVGANPTQVIQCEAYLTNKSNTADLAGFTGAGLAAFIRCISHDNAGSNANGFRMSGGNQIFLTGCISDTNGGRGLKLDGAGSITVDSCDFYNNTSDGIFSSTITNLVVQNSNFVKNGGWGLLFTAATNRTGFIMNCGFGSGTQANTNGTISLPGGIVETGSVTYASNLTPWTDPDNGDFRINLAAAKGTGSGGYTQTQGGYAGTVAFPDIGAGQASSSASGGGGGGRIRFIKR